MTADPEVHFEKVRSYAVPSFADDVMVVCYRPKAADGWVLANAWHESSGIITTVVRKACVAGDTETAASSYYDL